MRKKIEIISWLAAIVSAIISLFVLTNTPPSNENVSIGGDNNTVINNNKGEVRIEK